jgi:hypothetical protein
LFDVSQYGNACRPVGRRRLKKACGLIEHRCDFRVLYGHLDLRSAFCLARRLSMAIAGEPPLMQIRRKLIWRKEIGIAPWL